MEQWEWQNWSRSLKFTPGKFIQPETEEEAIQVIQHAAEKKQQIRLVGKGHSSMPLVETDKTLLSLEKLKRILHHDNNEHEATILPGMTVKEAGKALYEKGLSMHNTGDVDVQMVAGAIGTGTHGSGQHLPNLSAMLIGGRLIDGMGRIKDFSIEDDPEFIDAIRVALGSLGFLTRMRLKLQPAFQLHRLEWCTHVDNCMEHLDELIHDHRNFDFYWYPRNDLVKLRTLNFPGEGPNDIPYAKQVKEENGWIHEILPRIRVLKYDEMEYAIPKEAGPECFREIRKRIKDKHRHYVGWRVLYRTIKGDQTWLSPFYGRDSVTIAILQNVGLEYWAYFKDIEPIFQAYGGRPHWGKKHTMTASQLQPLYPQWDNFLKLREKMDPHGIFLNDHLKELFGI
jgi:FAD/FMN-containing dehydrogenase